MGNLFFGAVLASLVFAGLHYHVIYYEGDYDVVLVYPKAEMTFDNTFVDLAQLDAEDIVDRWPVFRAMGDVSRDFVLALVFGDVHEDESAEALSVSLKSRQFRCSIGDASLFCLKL